MVRESYNNWKTGEINTFEAVIYAIFGIFIISAIIMIFYTPTNSDNIVPTKTEPEKIEKITNESIPKTYVQQEEVQNPKTSMEDQTQKQNSVNVGQTQPQINETYTNNEPKSELTPPRAPQPKLATPTPQPKLAPPTETKPEVTVRQNIDFGPYMRDLQRRIKMNWNPPKGNESKQVVVLFKIAKSGQLLSSKVTKSSGDTATDQAALNAIMLTAPFRPLPADFAEQSIDIQFTFDYNVFGTN